MSKFDEAIKDTQEFLRIMKEKYDLSVGIGLVLVEVESSGVEGMLRFKLDEAGHFKVWDAGMHIGPAEIRRLITSLRIRGDRGIDTQPAWAQRRR